MIFEGIYRRFAPLKSGKGPIDARLTHIESLAVDQVAPSGFELSRAGRRFYLAHTGAVPTGIAPVQAFPTTAAQWFLWNPEAFKSYLLETLGAMVFSGTTGLGGELLGAICRAPANVGAAVAGFAVANGSGGNLSSRAVLKSGIVITDPAAPNWFHIAEQLSAAAIVGPASCIVNRAVAGRVVIPPGMGLALAVVAPAGAVPLYLPIAEWSEVEADLE